LSESFVLKARHGKALRLNAGARIAVINTYGQQVVDTWALCASDPGEAMSMEHTRSCLDKLAPAVGDELFTDRRRAILRLVADTSPGVHDTLLSACDEERYRLLGFKGKHRSCAENFAVALAEIGIECRRVPSPWNLFENVVIGQDGRLSISPPRSRLGDRVELRALIDVIVVFSACPMDIAPTNGLDRCPRDVTLLRED
jgi:uncharacterized protein